MRIPLIHKAYQERSPIASNQKTINLYLETNKQGAPSPTTYYLTPGTSLITFDGANANKVRCTYRTSIGTAYIVVGANVYFMAANNALVFVGTIPDRPSQVYMADNGQAAVLVDGSSQGWAIDLTTNAFGPIIDASFYGADFVVFLDTFFVFNRPATNQFYISLSNVSYTLLTAGTSFDPLDIAAKAGSSDPIVAILTIHKELWLIGALTIEVWQGTGAADFYFQIVQGAYIDHGCIAAYSATNTDVLGFFLMQDRAGKNIVVRTDGYGVTEISTSRLVAEFNSYTTTSDAIGFCFQLADHAFYVLAFPSANKTWLYDLKENAWSEWAWYNIGDGSLNRHRANCGMFFNNKNMIGDWENGKIYSLETTAYLDVDAPIIRVKTYGHMMDRDYNRVIYNAFDADMQVATQDPVINQVPLVNLSWSDDRGETYGFPVQQSMGRGGERMTVISWNRLGYARDRLFKLQWSEAINTSLNGAFVDITPAKT